MKIENMHVFKPAFDDPKALPDYKGIYIITALLLSTNKY